MKTATPFSISRHPTFFWRKNHQPSKKTIPHKCLPDNAAAGRKPAGGILNRANIYIENGKTVLNIKKTLFFLEKKPSSLQKNDPA
jgi:hypothetical protein